MTPEQATDRAATILATFDLTQSVSETARQTGYNKGAVSRLLRRAGREVAVEPAQLRNTQNKVNWVEAWGNREQRGLEIVSERIENPDTDTWDIMRWTGIASDKRYREEHPESVRGVNISGQQVQVIVDL